MRPLSLHAAYIDTTIGQCDGPPVAMQTCIAPTPTFGALA